MKTEKPIYSIPELEVVLFEEDVLTASVVAPLGISFHGTNPDDTDANTGTGSEVDFNSLPFNQ